SGRRWPGWSRTPPAWPTRRPGPSWSGCWGSSGCTWASWRRCTPPPPKRRSPDVLTLIDTHAHLDDGQFAADLPEVLARAPAAGVPRVVAAPPPAPPPPASLALAPRPPAVFATAGVHPNHAAQAAPGEWDEVVRLAGEPRVVAVGETG